ncbi:MAG: response regulator transcription factor [Alphaproteobacteria bacterium]|nr:response regulator transcription factor [Alphaproteobacteria bacterium]
MRILLADDHELFADMLKYYVEDLEPTAAVEVVGTYDEAVDRMTADEAYDLVLLDLSMPGMDGAASVGQFCERFSGARVVVISGVATPAAARASMRAGAIAFIPKTLSGELLMTVLRQVLDGQSYFHETLADEGVAEAETADPFAALTEREREVLDQLTEGHANKVIGHNLGISEVTVKIHLHRIYEKIGAKNRADAVRLALLKRPVFD